MVGWFRLFTKIRYTLPPLCNSILKILHTFLRGIQLYHRHQISKSISISSSLSMQPAPSNFGVFPVSLVELQPSAKFVSAPPLSLLRKVAALRRRRKRRRARRTGWGSTRGRRCHAVAPGAA